MLGQQQKRGRRETASLLQSHDVCDQVFIMFLPTLRFFTGPLPPGALAARFFAAVILPPLLAFAI
jgi:hypothetical protein